MAPLNSSHASDLRGGARAVVDATTAVVDIVEQMHHTIQSLPGPLGKAPGTAPGATRGITGFVYRVIRGSVRLVGHGLDATLGAATGLLPEGESGPGRDALRSVLNGVYGDYLARTGNPLAIAMALRHQGRTLDPARPGASLQAAGAGAPTGKLLVLVHGLCMNDRQWHRQGHDHGAALAAALGYTPLYLRYNTGLPIHENGRALAALLQTLADHWPQPLQEIAIIGHSMGGLVARSACHQAATQALPWLGALRRLIFLGTPHHGSPLERSGHRLDYLMELSPYSAPLTRLGKTRSAGIRDLRHGSITARASEWVPLPEGVACHAVAATLASQRSVLASRRLGDGLVPLDSALGRHKDPARTLAFPKGHQWIGYQMGHLDLLSRPEVCTQLQAWLQAPL